MAVEVEKTLHSVVTGQTPSIPNISDVPLLREKGVAGAVMGGTRPSRAALRGGDEKESPFQHPEQ